MLLTRRTAMWELTKNRIAAITVAACLLVYAAFQGGLDRHLVGVGAYVGFSLALIWFGPELEAYRGPMGACRFAEPTPGIAVIVGGWLLLLATLFMIREPKPFWL